MYKNGSLQILHVQLEDNGEYVCQAVRPAPWGYVTQVLEIEVMCEYDVCQDVNFYVAIENSLHACQIKSKRKDSAVSRAMLQSYVFVRSPSL